MTLVRSRFADLFSLAADLGPYDFWPVLPAGQDPQLHVSLNDRPQPFHLAHEHDAVLVQFSGRASVQFPEGPVRWHQLVPGDHVYLPAGLPYRVITDAPCLQLLMKAEDAGLEAIAWYCDGCDQLLDRTDVDTNEDLVQRHFHSVCSAFNQSTERRTCDRCGTVRPLVDLTSFNWLAVADLIENPAPAPEPAWGTS
jgi:hypothetical protein